MIKNKNKININNLYSKISKYKYVSFDIFDTLIKRNVSNPKDIFDIIELTVRDDFANKRVKAEKIARKNNKKGEVTLQDIYEYYPSGNKEKLIELELKTEYEAIVPNIPIVDIYKKCIEDKKVVFITSDMYWPINAVKELLKKVGVTKYKKLYLSCTEYKTKSSGELFSYLLHDQMISASELIHIGDHPISDYKVPKQLGIAAVRIPKVLNRINFKKNFNGIQNNYLNSFINNTYSGNKDPYYEFGYSQFGKLLMGYSYWIHKKALEKNVENLYFFSRDGWIMKKAYDLCINDPYIQTHYLEVSRRSLRGPILWIDFNYEDILKMVVNAKLVTIDSIFDGLGLDINCYQRILDEFKIKKDQIYNRDTIINDKNLKKLILSLKSEIIKNSKKEYDALVEYLRMNNVKGKFGIVDIGYAGSMQRYLHLTLNQVNIEHSITGLYLCVADYYHKNDLPNDPLDLNGYLFDFKHNENSIDTRSSFVGLFESLFLEQDGSVKRYIKKDGDIFVERYPYEYLKNGSYSSDYIKIKSIQKGALDFIKAALNDSFLKTFNYTADDLFFGIMETGINPDQNDINLFSDMEFYDEGITTKLASPKRLIYYFTHMKQFKFDFLSCRWKIGFMKKLFKINLPYQKIYQKMKKVDGK